ncbi:MAG: O-antigen ligase family protein [Clostridia bacterium]|nr:O-antigen ligase family protein [Clostridia bacterium]
MQYQPKGALLPQKWNQNEALRDYYDGAIFFASLLIVAFRWEVVGCLVFLGIIGAALVLSDRLSDIFLPLILLTVFVTRCYDSFDVFIRYIPLYAAVMVCLVFHLVYYDVLPMIRQKAKPTFGASFPGLVAVTVALTLGGIGSLSASQYFRPMNLYYVLGLGILMPLLYLIVKPRADAEARDRFTRSLFYMGCLAAYAVVIFYARGWAEFRETYHALVFQSSNNLATFLMISLPIGFRYSKKYRALIFFPVLQYIALLCCNSRGGTVLGTIEFFALLVFFCFFRSDRFRRICFIATILLIVVLTVALLPKVLTFYRYDERIAHFSELSFRQLLRAAFTNVVDDGEARVGLLKRSFADFRSNPLFGVGLGYTGNEDLYNPVKGAMNWYHMWLPQIWGSLGIVGLLCFGYQLFLRIKLAFTRREFPEVTLSLCYAGLLLMSQVNPGEFCPIPYALIATVIFILIEPPPKAKESEEPQEKEITE